MNHFVNIKCSELLNLLIYAINRVFFYSWSDLPLRFFKQLLNINLRWSNEVWFGLVLNFNKLLLALEVGRLGRAGSLLWVWSASLDEGAHLAKWILLSDGVWLLLKEIAWGSLRELSLHILIAARCLLGPRWRQNVLLASPIKVIFIHPIKGYLRLEVLLLIIWVTSWRSIAVISWFSLKRVVSLINETLALRDLWALGIWHLMQICPTLLVINIP